MQTLVGMIDFGVEAFSFITAALIAFGSFYAYTKTHNQRHAAFGLAFLAIACGTALSTVVNWFVAFENLHIPLRGYIDLSYTLTLILMLSMTAVLAGFIILLTIVERIDNPKVIMLLILLAPLGTWIAHEFYLGYHLLSLAITMMIFHHYWRAYSENPSGHSLAILFAFGTLMLSQAVLTLTIFGAFFYIAGHAVRFVSFAILFFTLVSIYNTPSKKRVARVSVTK